MCDSMDESQNHYSGQKKPEEYIAYCPTYMKFRKGKAQLQ